MRNSNKTESQHNTQTLWHLSGQRTGDGDKSVFSAAVVYRHLLPLAIVSTVAIALVTELIQTVASVHQHSWSHWLVVKIREMRQIRAVLVMKYFLDLSIKYSPVYILFHIHTQRLNQFIVHAFPYLVKIPVLYPRR